MIEIEKKISFILKIMNEKYFNNRFLIYIFPFILGSLTVFSFQPF